MKITMIQILTIILFATTGCSNLKITPINHGNLYFYGLIYFDIVIMFKSPVLFLFLIFTLFTSNSLISQERLQQFIPLEFRDAYHKGTRSISGMPGSEYWQNHAKYIIEAELDHNRSLLKGEERITYFNNSPDTLQTLTIRLYQDIYKVGNSREFSMDEAAVNEGMVIEKLSLEGNTYDIDDKKKVTRSATNMIVRMENSLLPDSSIDLEIEWHYTISKVRPIRTGNYGENRFFVAYWYPQIAVYDDIDGWDRIEYRGAVEFYNDFNDYDVTIKTTDGFLIWATGKLVNLEEIYSGEVVNNYKGALSSDEVRMIFTADACRNGDVLKKKENR